MNDVRNGKLSFEDDSVQIGSIPVLYTGLFGVGNLPFVMNIKHAYTNMVTKEDAIAERRYTKKNKEHYRGMSVDGMSAAIAALQEPIAILDSWRVKNAPSIAVILDVEGYKNPLYGVIQFYANRREGHSAPHFTHALVTIYDKLNLSETLHDAVENGKVLYVKKGTSPTGTHVTKAYASLSDDVLTSNLARFNEELKTFRANRGINFSRELPQGSESIIPYAERESRSEGGTRTRPRRRPEMPELFG